MSLLATSNIEPLTSSRRRTLKLKNFRKPISNSVYFDQRRQRYIRVPRQPDTYGRTRAARDTADTADTCRM